MYNQLIKYLLVVIGCFGITTVAISQPKDNSPFSRFGLGDFLSSSLPSSQGMGGLHTTYHDFFEANLENPASLGFLQYTSLQVGMYAKVSSIKRFENKNSVWSGNLDHLSLNIPLINPLNDALERRETKFSWGTSVSMRPYAQVGYDVRISDTLDDIGLVYRNFSAKGGLYQFTWSNGIKYQNLSVGFNLGYLYGNQEYSEDVGFADLSNPYSNYGTNFITYKGFQFKLGALYEQPLDLKEAREKDVKPSKFLSAGFTWNKQTNFSTESDSTLILENIVTSHRDTVFASFDKAGSGTIPTALGFGLMYREAGKFRIGVDYQTSDWTSYSNDARQSTLGNSYRLAFGAALIPDANALTSYWKRVEYRAGFYAYKDPRIIEGENIDERAITFGASLPLILQRNIAWFQIGFDVGSRTGGANLKDTFVRGRVGFILNDNSWFIRSKYN